MTKVRLEIDEVHIKRRRKRWVLYFVIMAEHPEDPDKMIITTLPQYPFKLSSSHENSFYFDTAQEGSEGLYVLSRELPEDRELNVHVYLHHPQCHFSSRLIFLQGFAFLSGCDEDIHAH